MYVITDSIAWSDFLRESKDAVEAERELNFVVSGVKYFI